MVSEVLKAPESKYNYTIVIPHYNIPELLRRCLNSIPTRDDTQIIVVDDCSPNAHSYTMLIPELNRNDVEFYSTPKGGSAGRARNIGIEHAKGIWVTFIDADDLFNTNYNELLDKNIDCEADVIFYQSKSVMSDDLTKSSNRNIFDHHFREYFRNGNESLLKFEFDAPWGKFVKKDLIDKNSIRFDEIRYSNDTFFSACVGLFAKKILVSPEQLYIVTERNGSLTSGKMKTVEEWRTRYGSSLRVQQLFDNNHIKYKRYAFADYLYLIWNQDKVIFLREYLRLNLVNKFRFLYYICRMKVK